MLFHRVVIIGAGESGCKVAIKLAQSEIDVLLVENNEIGGSYIYSHDIPKKAFKEIDVVEKSKLSNLSKIINRTVGLKLKKLKTKIAKYPNLKIIKGSAKFLTKQLLEITQPDNRMVVSFEECVISTGKQKMEMPSINGLNSITFMHQHNSYYGDDIPSSVAVIGCNPESLEFADIYADLGVKVKIFDSNETNKILVHHDATTVNYLIQSLLAKNVEFFFGADINLIQKKISDNLNSSAVQLFDQEQNEYLTDSLYTNVHECFEDTVGLLSLGIKFNEGGILVTDGYQTALRNIYAFGSNIQRFKLVNQNIILANLADKIIHNVKADSKSRSVVLFNSNNSNQTNFLKEVNFGVHQINTINPIATLGLSYRQATGQFGSLVKFEIYLHLEYNGFVKVIYNDQSGQLFGIALAGQTCKKINDIAFLSLKNNQNHKEFKTTLTILGYQI